MAETLTESFCERCGTRYEFKAPTRLNPLRKTRGFVGGLKNWVTSQDDMSDAMRDAMRQQEEALAAAQLEAFHESFNFCIDCRQYTCVNCWNDSAGRCRSCAPIAGTDDLAERLAASMTGNGATAAADPLMDEDQIQRRLGLDAWPTSDLPAATNGHAHVEWPVADAVAADAEPEPVAAEAEPEQVAEGYVEPWAAGEEAVAAEDLEPEPVAAEDLEPEPVAAEDLEPEPMVAEDLEPEPMVAEDLEPEPMVAEDLERQPVVAEAETVEPAVVEPEPEVIAAALESEAEVAAVVADAGAPRPPLRVVAWEADAAYEVMNDEALVAEDGPQPLIEPEPVAAEAEPEPVAAEAEPEPVAAEAEPEPVAAEAEAAAGPEPEVEPVVEEAQPEPAAAEAEAGAEAEPEPAPVQPIGSIRDTILRFPSTPAADEPAAPRQAAEDDAPEVAARRAQLDLLGLGDPGEGPVEPSRPSVVPYRSRGAAPGAAHMAAARAAPGGFWEASAREVAGAPANIGVQNCGQCGLSLSANARFCRRCGTRQAQSA